MMSTKDTTTPATPPSAQVSPAAAAATFAKDDLVLARDQDEGWFEAVVMDVRSDGSAMLKWRDFSNEPVFYREANQLAPLPPGISPAPKAAS